MNKDLEEEFYKKFVKDNGKFIEPSFKDPNGSVGPILNFIQEQLNKRDEYWEYKKLGEKCDSYSEGYNNGKKESDEKWKKKIEEFPEPGGVINATSKDLNSFYDGYKQALEDIQNKIK